MVLYFAPRDIALPANSIEMMGEGGEWRMAEEPQSDVYPATR